MERVDCEVVVIGAGLSGLVAARRLEGAGLSVQVVEARDRVGGRLLNVEVGGGQVVELGGQFVGPVHHRVSRLLDELGIQTFRTYNKGLHLSESQGRLVRYRRVPRLSVVGLLDAGLAIRRLDRAARQVPLERPWEAAKALDLDQQTAETWIRRTVRSHFGRSTLRLFVRGLFSAEPENLSALHLLTCVHAGGGFFPMASTTAGAQQDRVVGGSAEICTRLSSQLSSPVRLGTPVRRLRWSDDSVVAESDSGSLRGHLAVMALPAALAACIDYRPALPPDRSQLMQRMPHGNVIKSVAVYDEPWWRAEGLSGQAASDEGAVSATYDSTPPAGSPGVLTAFVEGRRAQQLSRLSFRDRRETIAGCLERFFGPRARDTCSWHELDWSAEEWSRGCYGAHLPPGVWTQYGPALRGPVGAMHWAGSETATRWPGYMDGAVASGERVAAEILRRRPPAGRGRRPAEN